MDGLSGLRDCTFSWICGVIGSASEGATARASLRMKKEGRVGTGFVPGEAWGDEEENMLVASAPKLLEARPQLLDANYCAE